MNVDKFISESLDDPAKIAETVIHAVIDADKKALAQQLRRLKKIKGSWTQSILSGYPFLEGGAILELTLSLQHLLAVFYTQEHKPNNDREWDRAMAARFPTLDAALTVLNGCEKLTPELYELAYDSVGPWDDYGEGFSIGDVFGMGRD